MKRVLAILTVVGLLLALPLASTALASSDDGVPEDQAEGIYTPPEGEGGGGDDEQGAMGDPHDLGGGFRGSTAPPSQQGAGEPEMWLLPVLPQFLFVF